MKLWFLLAFLAVAACEKTSDLPAMQHEMTGMVKNYAVRFDELEQRGGALNARLGALPADAPGVAEANNTLTEASNHFREVKSLLDRAPNEIKAAAAAGKPDQLRQIVDSIMGGATDKAPPTDLEVELGRASELLQRKLEEGFIQINSGLDAVESAIGLAEMRPAPAAKQAAAKTEPPAEPAPAPAAAAEPASGSASPPTR